MSYLDVDVCCPYFERLDQKTGHITCEGILPGSTVKCHFRNGTTLKDALLKYCCQKGSECPWRHFLDGKYTQ